MGVPLYPLAAAYGLGLGHLAGRMVNRGWQGVSPAARNPLTVWSHDHPFRPYPPGESIKVRPRVRSAATARSSRTMAQTRKRRFRRRRRGRRLNYIRRSSTPWKMVRVMKTVKYVALNPGVAGAISVATFMANSAYDPTDATGSGQPLGWDQATALYERYAVIGCKIFVEATSADATHPIALGINANGYQTAKTTYEHYKELPVTSFKLMTPEQDKVTLSLKFPISKFYGHRKFLSDNRLSALVNTSPDDKVYAHLFAQPVDQATDTGAVHCVVTMYQTIVFYSPRVLDRS